MDKVYESLGKKLSTLAALTESGDYDKAYNQGKAAALGGKSNTPPWEPGYPNDLLIKAFKMGYKDWKPKTAAPVAGKYVLALTSKNGIIGYYVADDQDVVADSKKAMKYNTEASAKADCKLCNQQWDLDRGQKFVVTPLSAAPKAIKEGKEYGDSSDFESDISELEQLVKKFDAILNKSEFAAWVEATDDNFGRKGGQSAGRMYEKLGGATENLKDALDAFYQYMIDVSE